MLLFNYHQHFTPTSNTVDGDVVRQVDALIAGANENGSMVIGERVTDGARRADRLVGALSPI